VLNGRLSLWDVDDVEKLANHVIVRARLELRPHQRESLLAFLISEAWTLSLRYQPGNGSTTTFSGWATTNLQKRITDWFRQEPEFGSTRVVYPRPQLLSLDGELAGVESCWPVDATPDRSPDLMRALRAGGSTKAGASYTNGDRAHGRAQGGDRAAA
jgi:hypothetical protein